MQDEKEMKVNIKVTGREAAIDIANMLACVQPKVRFSFNTCQCTTNVYLPVTWPREAYQLQYNVDSYPWQNQWLLHST